MKYRLIKLSMLIFMLLIGIVSAIEWDNVAYWSLDESSEKVKDITGNGNDGVIAGNPIRGVNGIIGKAININHSEGFDNYVNTSDIDLKGSASYSLWIYLREDEGDQTYLSKRDRWGGTTIEIHSGKTINFCIRTVSKESKKGYTPWKHFLNTLSRIFLGRDLKGYTFYGLTALEESCVSSDNLPKYNSWHHIIAIYNRTNKIMSLYIDGMFINIASHSSGLPTNNKNYVIGANAMGKEGFDGGKGGSEGAKERIDEVGIWNRVLSYEEVLELYNSGKGLGYKQGTT